LFSNGQRHLHVACLLERKESESRSCYNKGDCSNEKARGEFCKFGGQFDESPIKLGLFLTFLAFLLYLDLRFLRTRYIYNDRWEGAVFSRSGVLLIYLRRARL